MGQFTTEDLIRKAPKFHEGLGGEPHSHALADHVLAFVDGIVSGSMSTLETGAGVSTVLFALKECRHTCITPAEAEVERIKSFCESHRISTEKIQFIVGKSQNILPYLENEEFDLVLIDGSHSFPVAFLDFYYVAIRLTVGGILIIDDTNIWTGAVLRKFLLQEPEWELLQDFPRSSAFVKSKQVNLDNVWLDQKFVKRRSFILNLRGRLRMMVFLIRQGEFRLILRKSIRAMRLARR